MLALSRARRRGALLCLAATVAGLTSAGPAGSPAHAGSRYSKTSRVVRPGLTLMKVVDSVGPNRIKVLKIDPSTDLTLDVELSNDALPGRETTSSMARRRGAIAAVNGSMGVDWGRPFGLFAEDGDLHTTPILPGAAFGLSKDETTAYIDSPDFQASALNLDSGARWPVPDWNEQEPGPGGIAGYTASGGEAILPPRNACSVRLLPVTKHAWGPKRIGVNRTYTVERVRCMSKRLRPAHGVVLAAPRGTGGASTLKKARVGESIRLGWSLGWAGVLDVIAGSPILMKQGEIVISPCSDYVCQRHPRTGVGVTPAGDILLVTVDGRQTGSVGLDVVQFARLMKWLGAESALNLDGGGSSTMYVNGRIINSPSDGTERPVVSSLVVIDHPDYGEPRP